MCATHSFFFRSRIALQGLTEGQLRVLQRQIAVKDVTRGDLILRAGEAIRVLYIIQKGTVKVIDQADRIKQLGAGDFFGDECLSVFQQRSPKTYVAISDATLLGVNKETFDDEGERECGRSNPHLTLGHVCTGF